MESLSIDSVLACYEARTVPLETPPASESLGFNTSNKVLRGTTRENSPTSNLFAVRSPSSSPRPTKLIHHELAAAGIIGMVSNVVHGTFNANPATLVIFTFSFRSGNHALHFKNANVKATFEKHPSTDPEARDPAIVKFAPRKIYGLPVTDTRKAKYSAEFGATVPVGPLEVGPKALLEKESEYEKEYRFKTVGNFWSRKHGSEWDIVYWVVQENKKSDHGIPDRLNVAVIVESEDPFQATVEITVDTPLIKGLFGFPWSKANPATFTPGVSVGDWGRTLKFEELDEEDWREIIPYEEEWKEKFTESVVNVSREQTPNANEKVESTIEEGDELPSKRRKLC
ncbi:hypothetical protein PVAG01_10626 [Phlyctema vagabunda]|uniref:Uncharacterized protein n=1 Tax=Phlyctema vagabunda TaxID=108571 RepID=A0ABR4P2T9_9HELO